MKLHGSLLLDLALITTSVMYGGYLLATQGSSKSHVSQASEKTLLPGYVSSELTALRFHGAHGEFSIQADPGHPGEYVLAGDVTGHADVALVHELSATLEFAKFKRRLVGAAHVPDALRHQAPQVSVHITSAGRKFEVRVYEATSTSAGSPDGEVYVSVHTEEESTWGVTSARLLSSLLRSKQEFRGNQLFPFSMSQTLGLRIADAHSSLELRGDELGFLLEPEHKRADRTLSDVLFFQLAQAKLTSFLAPDEAERLVQADPLHKTVVQHGAGKSVTLLLGGRCPGDATSLVALRRTPPEIAGCAPRAMWAGLSLTPDELLARSASTLNPDEIDHVIVSGPLPSLDLMRQGANFVRLDAEQQPIPNAATDELLQVLTRGKLVLTQAPAPTEPATRTVTVIGQPRARTLAEQPWNHASPGNTALPTDTALSTDTARQVIDIYDRGTLEALAHRLDDDTWFTVPPSLAWAFAQDDTWTKSRILLDVAAQHITGVRVVMSGGQVTARSEMDVVRAGSGFAFGPAAAHAAPDQSLCRGLFEGLAHLTAERYLNEKGPPQRIWYRVHITRSPQEPVAELIVGPRVRGGYQAWFSLAQAQFVLDEEMALRLATSLFDRSPAQLNPEAYSTIKLTSQGREVKLKRVAGELYPDSEGMGAEDVPPLLDALRGLTVLAYLPEHELRQPAEQTIEAWTTQDAAQHVRLELVGLHPYQEGVAHWARVSGVPGAFALAPTGVQALRKLL